MVSNHPLVLSDNLQISAHQISSVLQPVTKPGHDARRAIREAQGDATRRFVFSPFHFQAPQSVHPTGRHNEPPVWFPIWKRCIEQSSPGPPLQPQPVRNGAGHFTLFRAAAPNTSEAVLRLTVPACAASIRRSSSFSSSTRASLSVSSAPSVRSITKSLIDCPRSAAMALSFLCSSSWLGLVAISASRHLEMVRATGFAPAQSASQAEMLTVTSRP